MDFLFFWVLMVAVFVGAFDLLCFGFNQQGAAFGAFISGRLIPQGKVAFGVKTAAVK